jgi:2-amino-4-hydroxy-6-hydroxymethyldihydropteridine diphosphokinase
VFVALGSNLGDRAAHLAAALAALRCSPDVELVRVSGVYETAPVGPAEQGPYLNAVAELRTRLAPRALLARLRAIEAARGRTRSGERWGARTLDLDLLLFGERRIDESDLEVPHPRMAERAFVLEPLREIAAELRHPVSGETIADLARGVRDPVAVRRVR